MFPRPGLPGIDTFKKYYWLSNIYQELLDGEDTDVVRETQALPWGFTA